MYCVDLVTKDVRVDEVSSALSISNAVFLDGVVTSRSCKFWIRYTCVARLTDIISFGELSSLEMWNHSLACMILVRRKTLLQAGCQSRNEFWK